MPPIIQHLEHMNKGQYGIDYVKVSGGVFVDKKKITNIHNSFESGVLVHAELDVGAGFRFIMTGKRERSYMRRGA